jgi:hypothetical protein
MGLQGHPPYGPPPLRRRWAPHTHTHARARALEFRDVEKSLGQAGRRSVRSNDDRCRESRIQRRSARANKELVSGEGGCELARPSPHLIRVT